MKKVIVLGGVAAAMFTVSSLLSYWLTQGRIPSETPPAQPQAGAARPQSPAARSEHTSPDLSPAVRPPFNPGAEELLRLRTQIKDSQDRLQTEEKRLATRKQLLDLVLQDIRGERTAIEGLRKEMTGLLKTIDERLAAMELKSSELDRKNRKYEDHVRTIQKSLTEVTATEQEQIQRMAEMYNNMDPTAAGNLLQGMADTGAIDTAVKILSNMSERRAAKVLAELSDRGVVIQILDRMKTLKRSAAVAPTGPAPTPAPTVPAPPTVPPSVGLPPIPKLQ